METQENELTLKEKVAIQAIVFGIIKNWYDAYTIAYDGRADDLTRKRSLKTIVSRWKNHPKIKAFYNDCISIYNQQQNTIQPQQTAEDGKQENGKGESIHTKREKTAFVDFSNPQNQMQKLNELVNSSEDVGETLDALKVIISSQKADRESAREGKQVKAYIPMTCNNCPLYTKRAKKDTIQ